LPDGTLPERSHRALDSLFVNTPLAQNIVSVKIWRKDQMVIYASMSKDVIGKRFASNDVAKAFLGQVVAEFEDMISTESAYEQSLKMPLIEVYVPLYRTGTSEIIAVGEIYDDARELAQALRGNAWQTWLVVSLTTLLMLSVLYGIVRRGSQTIAAQRAELDNRVAEAHQMANQNAALRTVAEKTRLDANEANEELIGRIGQDLHDGPIQLLSLLMLRVNELGSSTSEDRNKSASAVHTLTENVIEELRTLSTGLVLPEIGDIGLAESIQLAICRHESLTGTSVQASVGKLPDRVSDALKICVYRIVQESLTNSFRHAAGVGQRVEAEHRDSEIRISVSDTGKGISNQPDTSGKQEKLGLRGIHNRAQAFGGHVTIESDAQSGTRVLVVLPI
jgi:signal transduction histidine kinase